MNKSPFYTAEHLAYRDVVRRFVEKEIIPFAHEWDEAGTFPRALYEKAAALPAKGPLRTELERIEALSPDPKTRTEAALAARPRNRRSTPPEAVDEIRIVHTWIAAHDPPRLELDEPPAPRELAEWVRQACLP